MSHKKITVNQNDDLKKKKRYEINSDYISDEFRRLNNSLQDDGFSSDYALSIYKRYTDIGKDNKNNIIGQHRAENSGSVDTTAIADAKRYEMDLKNQAYEKIADYTLKKADAGLKILEKFSDINQKDFDNVQTEKLNDIKIAKDKAEITGEVPDEIKDANPYINPKTGNVYDVNVDYQEKINELKNKLEDDINPDEKDRIIKEYNNLIDARYAKITKNKEFLPYIDQGDIVSEYKSMDNKKNLRENDSMITKSMIESSTEKYISDNSLSSDIYKADKETEAEKYASLNKLKEKALDGIARHEELEEKINERISKENAEARKRAEEEKKEQEYKQNGRTFGYPVNPSSYTVTSGFGKRDTGIDGASKDHKAIDLACSYGENVMSAEDGVVTFAGWVDGYGNTVEILHDDNIVTKYHHMAETPSVKRGDTIKKGQTIGKVGSTGISSGNHLDFQIFENGVAVDPTKYIPFV